MYCDMAAQCMGAISSGVYTTDSPSQLAYLVNDSQSKFLFVENDEQLDKYLEVAGEMPSLKKVIILDPDGLHDFAHPGCMFLRDLYDLGRQNDDDAVFNAEIDAKPTSHDPATRLVDVDAGGRPVACTPQAFLDWEASRLGLNSSADLNETEWAYTPASFALHLKQTYVAGLRDSNDPTDVTLANSWMGLSADVPTRVRALVISANSTLPFNPRASATRRHVEAWNAVMDDVNDGAPVEGFATAWPFSYYITSKVMVASTYSSVGTTYAIAVACIFFVTGNWILTLIAAVNLGAVVLTVIALFVVTGNSLGWVEAILLSLLPGLAVDAPIHILEPFAFSHAHGRANKARFALLELGVSVLGGALTTLVPNLLLLAAAMPFFQSFGKVVAYAITAALVLALTVLVGTLDVFGPDDFETGNVYLWIAGSCGKGSVTHGKERGAAAPQDKVTVAAGRTKEVELA
jgi:hypothetical protein